MSIQANFVVLCQELDVGRIAPILRQMRMLTTDEFEELSNPAMTMRVKREKLLLLLPRKGSSHFQRFAECLVWSGQEGLARRIGVDVDRIPPRPANIPPPAPPQPADQAEMFAMFQQLIAQGSTVPPTHPMNLPGGRAGYPMTTPLANSLPSTVVPHPSQVQAPPPNPRTVRNNPPRVLLLYCKEGSGDDVLDLADLLTKSGGLQCEFDGYDHHHQTNWDSWTQKMIQECDFVLLLCSHKFMSYFRDPKHELVDMIKGKFWADSIVNLIDARKFIPVFLNSKFDQRCVPIALQTATHYELEVASLAQEMEETSEDNFSDALGDLLGEHKYQDIASLLAFLRGVEFAARPPQPQQPVVIRSHPHRPPDHHLGYYPTPLSPPTGAEFISEGDLLKIADRLPREWQHLGIKLGVDYSVLETLRSRHPFDPRQSTMEMFGVWQRRGREATRERLKQALIELGYGRLVNEIFGRER